MTAETSAERTVALSFLRALVDGLTRSARAIESATGLTNAQLYPLLRQPWPETGTLSVNELAERVQTRQNAVSAVLRRLIESGLVHRVPIAGGRTARRAVAHTEGEAAGTAGCHVRPAEQLVQALATLPPRELAALTTGLGALVSRLGLDVDGAPFLFEDVSHGRSRRKAP